jgi:hypothetical protein
VQKFRASAFFVALAFYNYDEPSRGHFTDYTAHAIFATVTARWP